MPKTPRNNFWDKEYHDPKHLSLSTEPAEDLVKFTRWLIRDSGKSLLNPTALVLDLGSGNGRNLIYLAKEFGSRGVGYDVSGEAVSQAKKASVGLPLSFSARSIAGKIYLPNNSVSIVLDMMTSHVLRLAEREALRDEIFRVLKPGGFLFFKTFLLDEDVNAATFLREHPSDEPGSYIHPTLHSYEHVWQEDELRDFFGSSFEILKIEKSHKHLLHGKPFKRRSIMAYMRKG
ncbi:MAG: hypothetical protein A3A22_01355 [Candidatus Taylorbacteria bacterium RIFCSPLOWO2_01_FULL_45_34b]|nr:MAG: hypothetical protein A3A22_01355 [Candidatus Taylorbacteria bacterium RIFCSPLOWO2_01_FULL_45_34b]